MAGKSNKYTGVFTPDEILRRTDISLLEKYILAEVVFFAEKGCFLSNAEFARRFGQSRRGVVKAIGRLKEKGEIVDGGKDCYHRKLLPKGELSSQSNEKQKGNSVHQEGNSVHSLTPKKGNSVPTKKQRGRNIKKQEREARPSAVQKPKTPPPKKQPFMKPTIQQLKEKISEKGYSVDADVFYAYYEENDWIKKNGKPVKDWSATLRTWSARENERGNSNGKKTTQNRKFSTEAAPGEKVLTIST